MMLPALVRASVEGTVFVAVIFAVTRAFGTLSPAVRAMLWWLAAAKFVIAVAGITPVVLPMLPAAARVATGTIVQVSTEPSGGPMQEVPDRPNATASSSFSSFVSWPLIALGLWAVGVTVVAGAGAVRWWHMRAIVERSAQAPSEVQARAGELAKRFRLRRAPAVRVSGEIDAPLVVGLLRPVVLLPSARFNTLSGRQQEMALAHEMAHVKRGDLWLGCVPAVAERLFFFHPFAHFAAREYALWREAACDAAVLSTVGAAPQEYGRLLLDLGVARRPAVLVAAGTAWSFSSMKRRIAMLHHVSTGSLRARLLAIATVGAAAVALVPVQLAARQGTRDGWTQLGAQLEASPDSGVRPDGARRTHPLFEPVATGLEGAGAALGAREPEQRDNESRVNFVFFADDDHTNMSGSMQDIDRARRFKQPGEQLLWFRRGGREYVIRDRDTLSRVEALWGPVSALGERMGEVGGKQGAIGALQGEIGAKQGEVGAVQGMVGARQGTIGERQGQLANQEWRRSRSAADREGLERDQRALDAEMRNLDREMRFLDEKMRDLDRPMRELDEQMKALDREMSALDREMKVAVAKADEEMLAIFERAIASGTAQPDR